MLIELKEALTSLDLMLAEENGRLSAPGYAPIPPEFISAKARIVGQIEAGWVRLSSADGDPAEAMDHGERDTVVTAIAATMGRLEENARLLQRRIALCDDLLGAIRAEARRVTGGRNMVYGARGAIARTDLATPISINTRL